MLIVLIDYSESANNVKFGFPTHFYMKITNSSNCLLLFKSDSKLISKKIKPETKILKEDSSSRIGTVLCIHVRKIIRENIEFFFLIFTEAAK